MTVCLVVRSLRSTKHNRARTYYPIRGAYTGRTKEIRTQRRKRLERFTLLKMWRGIPGTPQNHKRKKRESQQHQSQRVKSELQGRISSQHVNKQPHEQASATQCPATDHTADGAAQRGASWPTVDRWEHGSHDATTRYSVLTRTRVPTEHAARDATMALQFELPIPTKLE